jgi:DNA replication licensing factor MCM6
MEVRGDVQDSLPSMGDESQDPPSIAEPGEDVRVFYLVHPSVDTESSSMS